MAPESQIAIFPLSTIVLFPRAQTPLHLFEPRYRQMAERVLADDRRIGMVAVPPEHVGAMAGDPPVYPVGCAGTVAQAQKLADGRYNIVLVGSRRFRILRERPRTSDRLYRIAEIEPLEDAYEPSERARVAELRGRIAGQVVELVQRSEPGRGERISEGAFEGMDDVVFVNTLANGLPFAPGEKQGLLEADGIAARFERLEGLLAFRLAELGSGGGAGTHSVH